jgi:hypothetical protein
MTRVRIYKPIKNPMQSGKAKQHWLVEHEQGNTRFIEPLMGWTANTDTKPQLRLTFNTKEEAVAYANRKGFEYQVIEPKNPRLKLQSYADNFC